MFPYIVGAAGTGDTHESWFSSLQAGVLRVVAGQIAF